MGWNPLATLITLPPLCLCLKLGTPRSTDPLIICDPFVWNVGEMEEEGRRHGNQFPVVPGNHPGTDTLGVTKGEGLC